MKNGFTLIELLLVFSIVTILSGLGTAAFINYNQSQKVSNVSLELVSMLNLAKSRATSQVKPSSCVGSLNGYQIGFCKLNSNSCLASQADNDYAVYAVCNDEIISPPVGSKKLPDGITFDTTNLTSIFFKVLTGGVNNYGTIKITGYQQEKCVTISNTGSIQGPSNCQ